jgi:Fur family ferric uptake transcriptional regulator
LRSTIPDADSASLALLERFHHWLRARHLPVTRQRDLVARVVFAGGEHLSVEGVERRLRDRGTPVGTATVYRSLDVLVESGLVRSHDFGEGFRRFEPLLTSGQHGHLICSRCGRVTEFSTDRFERLLPMVADEQGFQLQDHRVEIRGLCATCREADAATLGRSGTRA